MFKRALHNPMFQWKHSTKHIKRTFYFSCVKNSLTLNSSAHQKSLLNINCVSSKKCSFGLYLWNKLNLLIINQLRCHHLMGTHSSEKRASSLLSNHRNLSSQNGKEFTQKTIGKNKDDVMIENIRTFCLSKRNLICVSGSDSLSFLQGLVTNDMNLFQREDKKALYAMILNVQGRVLYDLIIYAVPAQIDGENQYYLECDTNVSGDLVKFLKRYKIRKKVTITDLKGEFKSWASLSSPQKIKNSISEKETEKVLICVNDPRVPEFGSRLILSHDTSCNSSIRKQTSTKSPLLTFVMVNSEPVIKFSRKEEIENILEAFKKDTGSGLRCTNSRVAYVLSGNERDYHLKRYKLGIGEGIEDLPPGNCYPLECNLHFKNGVSFQKGCYIGQELTARTHHRGVVRKRLMPVFFESIPEGLSNDDKITDIEGKNLGKFRNYEGICGLALLRVAQALKANESGMNIKDYKLKTQIPEWWPKHEV